jgi:carnitine-CoA ligase
MHDYPYEHRALPFILADKAREHGDRVFLLGDHELSYAGLRDAAARFAGGLRELGIQPGDRVLFMLPNTAQTIITAFGISWAGAVSVPINTSYRGEMLRYLIEDADASLLVIAAEHLGVLAAVRDSLPALPPLVLLGGDATELADSAGPLAGVTAIPWETVAGGPPVPVPDLGPADLQAIMYTSGTTGPSKGVLVSYHHAYQYANPTGTHLVAAGDVVYVTLPLFHIGGQWAGIYAALLADGQALLKRKFSVSEFWTDIDKHGVTQTILLGVMSEFIWKQPPSDDDQRHALRRVAVTPPPKDAAGFAARFNLRICQGWGLTEAGCVTASPPFDEPARPTSCGQLRTDLFEMILADENDEPVPVGTPGEALIRPLQPNALMAGYWRKPEATVAAWRNLWLHSGDVLVQDEDGYYQFVDRQKDCIRRRGENISSLEVERAVQEHPEVLECAAIPVPGEDTEEEVKVVVTLRGSVPLTPAELNDFLEPRMPEFMLPRYIEIVPEMPRTPTEKIRKDVLRAAGAGPGSWRRPDQRRADYQRTADRPAADRERA